ncbi:Metallo-beta-lactamase superfamily protein [Marinitoga hydrogenitolerans DSM 16785]|uniref:Metallo-beta-lactamase superfamily protein n=1 Tax=Marinitoga hydrogenitolerans (strain DSM 16785 / JCM 12826 / AT1271) TaxID=1122195 RepID=A0A1M4XZA8_MARH1|nr:MBL fold metallo-hydrolase [Marinitoga hydrogenitolerans]SHE98775.1 Metallo-beta-lactamase superfamily protein [Marinitoga hydrogenitolerans DSM 16785]
MSNSIVLFENENHKFIYLGVEKNNLEGIFTNQFLIIHNNEGVLLDPGGVHVFPRVLSNVSEQIDTKNIKAIFYSHQDPDVSSGVALWSSTLENAKIYISKLWERFLPHFGVFDSSILVPIDDKGGKITFSDGYSLNIIPAHFLHSLGNFSVYDSISKILFSGDIGVGIVQPSEEKIFVEDFSNYKEYMEGFHKRYMASNIVAKKWVNMVSKLDVEMMIPQHGLLFKKNEYLKFLDWFKDLKCGVDIIDSIY